MSKYKVGDILEVKSLCGDIEIIAVSSDKYTVKVLSSSMYPQFIGRVEKDLITIIDNSPDAQLKPCPIPTTSYGQQANDQWVKDMIELQKKMMQDMGNFRLKPAQSKECQHEWKHYMGLTEVYHYCTKCDKKRF